MTPHQENGRRDDQKRHHSSANDMRSDSENLVSKACTQHKLDQHYTNGGSHQRANRPPVISPSAAGKRATSNKRCEKQKNEPFIFSERREAA